MLCCQTDTEDMCVPEQRIQCSLFRCAALIKHAIEYHFTKREFILPELAQIFPAKASVELHDGNVGTPTEDAHILVSYSRGDYVLDTAPYSTLTPSMNTCPIALKVSVILDIDTPGYYLTELMGLEIGLWLQAIRQGIRADTGIDMNSVVVKPTQENHEANPGFYHTQIMFNIFIQHIELQTNYSADILRSVDLSVY